MVVGPAAQCDWCPVEEVVCKLVALEAGTAQIVFPETSQLAKDRRNGVSLARESKGYQILIIMISWHCCGYCSRYVVAPLPHTHVVRVVPPLRPAQGRIGRCC